MNTNPSYAHWAVAAGKRSFDIAGALLGLAAGSVLFPLIALAIRRRRRIRASPGSAASCARRASTSCRSCGTCCAATCR